MNMIGIVGMSRSGSTLIEGALQNTFQVRSVGEVSYIWERGVQKNELCGCGTPFNECDFWQQVLRDGFGRLTTKDARRFGEAFESVKGGLFDFSPNIGKAYAPDPLFVDISRTLYTSIARIAGDDTIIDSSKNALYLASVARSLETPISFMHVYRDACGVVHSTQTPKVRPEVQTGSAYMGRAKTILHGAWRWKLRNSQSSAVGLTGGFPYWVVSYEAFCSDPQAQLSAIGYAYDLRRRQSAPPQAWHSVSGNPIRFSSKTNEIRLDQRWKTEMKPHQKAVVRLLTKKQQSKLDRQAKELASIEAP